METSVRSVAAAITDRAESEGYFLNDSSRRVGKKSEGYFLNDSSRRVDKKRGILLSFFNGFKVDNH